MKTIAAVVILLAVTAGTALVSALLGYTIDAAFSPDSTNLFPGMEGFVIGGILGLIAGVAAGIYAADYATR